MDLMWTAHLVNWFFLADRVIDWLTMRGVICPVSYRPNLIIPEKFIRSDA